MGLQEDNKKNKEYLFIDNAKGMAMNKSGGLEVISVYSEFQQYLNAFNFKYGKE
jgi:hypothetical protein